jgi:hypothetical protein
VHGSSPSFKMSTFRLSPRVRRAVLLTTTIALAALAARVYVDAATHGHRRGDGSLEQPAGSFVTVERWVGATHPTRWGRPAEYTAAFALGVASLAALLRALRSK